MIVVDTDVISYFWLQMTEGRSEAARAVRQRDANGVVPPLWRSEFRSVLRGNESEVSAASVLRLVDATGHSAYDCEYVALAQELGVPLVAADRQIVERFSETAVLLEDFAGSADRG